MENWNHCLSLCLKAHLTNYSWKVVFWCGGRRRFTSTDCISRGIEATLSLSSIALENMQKNLFGWHFRHWLITSKLHSLAFLRLCVIKRSFFMFFCSVFVWFFLMHCFYIEINFDDGALYTNICVVLSILHLILI